MICFHHGLVVCDRNDLDAHNSFHLQRQQKTTKAMCLHPKTVWKGGTCSVMSPFHQQTKKSSILLVLQTKIQR